MKRITVTAIFASLLTVQCYLCAGSAIVKKAKAGENVSFRFHFQTFSEDCSYQLKYNNIIFHDNGTTKESETYPRGKHNRSGVRLEIRQPEGVIVYLKIRQVQPSDAGPYVCLLQCLDHPTRQKHITLIVLYPAGPAECYWVDISNVQHMHYIHDHYMLECVAPTGNPQGTVICFELKVVGPVARLPPMSSVSEGIITTSFWFKKEVPVYCCSVSHIYQKHLGICVDFSFELTTNPPVSSQTSTRIWPATTIEEESSRTIVENAKSGTKSIGQGIVCRIKCLFVFVMITILSFM